MAGKWRPVADPGSSRNGGDHGCPARACAALVALAGTSAPAARGGDPRRRQQRKPGARDGRGGPGRAEAGTAVMRSWAAGQRAGAADGQLMVTVIPELVVDTCTSSARPEITASPNPAGTLSS